MHAYLISSQDSKKSQQKIATLFDSWKISIFDRREIRPEALSIGISQVKNLLSEVSLKPLNSDFTVVVIYQADLLTIEAQNSLLKILEEPPGQTRIILEAFNINSLLPTVISRCQIINVGSDMLADDTLVKNCLLQINQLLQCTSIAAKLQLLEPLAKSRQDALSFLDLALAACRGQMLSAQDAGFAKLIEKMFKAKTQLQANVNPRLAIDNIFI